MTDNIQENVRISKKLKITALLIIAAAAIITMGAIILKPSKLEVHFLDVGQGDSSLIICDGEAMLIDGGPPAASDFIFSYLKSHNVSKLRYIVNSHPEEDHIGGLSGALHYSQVEAALCPVSSYDSDAFRDFEKYLREQGVSVTVPNAGDTFTLGRAKITILAPGKVSDDMNNNSIVCKIEHGKNSFLFTGDAEQEEENDLITSGKDLKSTVLKVGHHGSLTSTSEDFLNAVSPEYAVISVGAGNIYGHPSGDILNGLKTKNITLYRTDVFGTIVCSSDGKKLSFTVQKNKNTDAYDPPLAFNEKAGKDSHGITRAFPGLARYVLNKSTKKFHDPGCSGVVDMDEKNKIYTDETREELIAKGYSPCGRCDPK